MELFTLHFKLSEDSLLQFLPPEHAESQIQPFPDPAL